MAREDLHFRLRIPEELKQRVEAAAAENHRSMTAEIVARLEESFQPSVRHSDVAASLLLLFNHMKKEGRDVDDMIQTLQQMAGRS